MSTLGKNSYTKSRKYLDNYTRMKPNRFLKPVRFGILSKGNSFFVCPPWIKILMQNPENTLIIIIVVNLTGFKNLLGLEYFLKEIVFRMSTLDNNYYTKFRKYLNNYTRRKPNRFLKPVRFGILSKGN